VIPTIPLQSPFWQGLARGDYFGTSVKITEADIYKVVGGIGKNRHQFFTMITYWTSTNHQKRPTTIYRKRVGKSVGEFL